MTSSLSPWSSSHLTIESFAMLLAPWSAERTLAFFNASGGWLLGDERGETHNFQLQTVEDVDERWLKCWEMKKFGDWQHLYVCRFVHRYKLITGIQFGKGFENFWKVTLFLGVNGPGRHFCASGGHFEVHGCPHWSSSHWNGSGACRVRKLQQRNEGLQKELVCVGCFLIGSTAQPNKNTKKRGFFLVAVKIFTLTLVTNRHAKNNFGDTKNSPMLRPFSWRIEVAGRNSYNRGLRLWRSKNFAEAAQCFRSAALNGHSTGAYALGVMLLNGHLAVEWSCGKVGGWEIASKMWT